jgi:hypothetical protein
VAGGRVIVPIVCGLTSIKRIEWENRRKNWSYNEETSGTKLGPREKGANSKIRKEIAGSIESLYWTASFFVAFSFKESPKPLSYYHKLWIGGY